MAVITEIMAHEENLFREQVKSRQSATRATKSKQKRKVRTKTGCLCCRKRKKKCDEIVPQCQACDRNGLQCVWPVGKEIIASLEDNSKEQKKAREYYKVVNQQLMDELDLMPRQKKVPTVKKSDLDPLDQSVATTKAQGVFVVTVMNSECLPDGSEAPVTGPVILKSPLIPEHFEKDPRMMRKGNGDKEYDQDVYDLYNSYDDEDDDDDDYDDDDDENYSLDGFALADPEYEDQEFCVTTLDPLMDVTMNNFRSWIPNVTMNGDEAFLYHIFVTEFMPSISPLHSHPALSPGAICIPQVIYSPVLREIFLGCGAVYLGNKNSEFKPLAVARYQRSLRLWADFLRNGYLQGDEDWALVAVSCMILMERSSGMAPTYYVRHLSIFFQLWQKRLARLNYVLPEKVSAAEQNLVEGFIFNYSVTILMCNSIQLQKLLPSPFDIFSGGIFPDLKVPIYKECAVTWMNNPITGSGLPAFKCAAKASWLCRLCLPLQEDNYQKCLDLQQEISNWVPETLPANAEATLSNYILLKNNISVSILTMRATNIIVTKMLHPELTSASSLIQADVEIVIEELVKISSAGTECCLPYWSILVAASATITEQQLQFFKDTTHTMAKVLNSKVAIQANKYLNAVWELNALQPGSGFEAMFNTDMMDKLVS